MKGQREQQSKTSGPAGGNEAWLKAPVQSGNFVSYDDTIDFTVTLTSLREALLESIAAPRRYDAGEVRANLKAHFAARHPDASEPAVSQSEFDLGMP